jgi:hypothetical protein
MSIVVQKGGFVLNFDDMCGPKSGIWRAVGTILFNVESNTPKDGNENQ